MSLKGWVWILLIIAVIESVIVIYVALGVFAGVINLGFFLPILLMQIFFGFYALASQERRKKIVFVNAGFVLITVSTFLTAMPMYTYKEAQELAISTNNADYDTTNQAELNWVQYESIPSTTNQSWLLKNNVYYVEVKNDERVYYYLVDPMGGDAVQLDEPYG